MGKYKDTPVKMIEIVCPDCKGYSKNITIVHDEQKDEMQCKCMCGTKWIHKINIHKAPALPEVGIWIEEGTGLICIKVRRIDKMSKQKKGIVIKLPENALALTREGAIYRSVILPDYTERRQR